MLPMVNPSTILKPLPKPILALQEKVVVDAGQAALYKAYPKVPVELSIVSTTLLNLNIMDCELAVKEYQISSLLSVEVQDGSGIDRVAPEVLAVTEAAQLVPNGCVVIGMAFIHSLFAGGAGTS